MRESFIIIMAFIIYEMKQTEKIFFAKKQICHCLGPSLCIKDHSHIFKIKQIEKQHVGFHQCKHEIQKANMKGFDTNVELNYRDNRYLPKKELFQNIEILFASLNQIATITELFRNIEILFASLDQIATITMKCHFSP